MNAADVETLTQGLIDKINVGAQDVHERGNFLLTAIQMLDREFKEVQKAATVDLNNLVNERRQRNGIEAAKVRLTPAPVIPSKTLGKRK